ncbi:MAG: ABC transporter permease [Jiangellaceae bacterium]
MTGLTGTLRLVRLAIRRDRVTLSAWILGLGVFMAATTAMFVDSFATEADVVRETQLVATNAGMRMLGLTSGPSVGGYMLHREYVTLAVLGALMSTLAVVRHTRQNEELGRAEMVGATVVGRYAGLAAAVIVAVGANIVLAVVLSLATLVNGLPVSGSFLTGASIAAVGVVFVGVAAISCQLSSTTRGATGIAGAALGLSFLLSGIGNMLGTVDDGALRVTSAWPAWLSPIGWGQQTRPFGGGHWWPLALFGILLAVLLTVAVALAGRRDVGRGIWPERRGRAHARSSLLSPTGLDLRMQRGALLGWAVALLAFGLIFGTLIEQVQDVQGPAADWYAGVAGTDQITDAYRASIIQMAGMFVAIYVVQILLRMRADEAGGTVESVLATGVSRPRWMLSHVVNASTGAVVLILIFAVSMGLATGLVLGDTSTQVREMAQAGLVQLPGILVVGGVVVVLVALLPGWAVPLSWAFLVASLVLGPMFGPSLGVPQWAQDASPFTHTPNVPATDLTAAPLVVLAGICVGLGVAGVVAIRRRNLVLPV